MEENEDSIAMMEVLQFHPSYSHRSQNNPYPTADA